MKRLQGGVRADGTDLLPGPDPLLTIAGDLVVAHIPLLKRKNSRNCAFIKNKLRPARKQLKKLNDSSKRKREENKNSRT